MSENTNAVAMNRPVSCEDIATKLGLSKTTVANCMSERSYRDHKPATVELVRKTAKEMGYDPNRAQARHGVKRNMGKRIDFSTLPTKLESPVSSGSIARLLGVSRCFVSAAINNRAKSYLADDIRKAAAMYGIKTRAQQIKEREEEHARKATANPYYRDTPFRTVQEQIDYMLYLRKNGCGNTEIAKRTGVACMTVRRKIGPTPADLANHNRSTAQTLRAQKNAARKAYIRNAPIAEYNKKVEEHNKLKAQIVQMEAELRPQTPAIEKIAAQKIEAPAMNLTMLSPTPIM